MRLICPNCATQYEVPDDAIPTEGRDVQCSSCGETWFQTHPDTEEATSSSEAVENFDTDASPDDEEEEALEATLRKTIQSGPEPQPAPEPELATVKNAEPAAPPETQDALGVADDDPAPEDETPPRRALDPAVASVLREEAALETRARDRETPPPLESQPDLGIGGIEIDRAAIERARKARERMERFRSPPEQPDATPSIPSPSVPRKEQLPKLAEPETPSAESNSVDANPPPRRRSSARSGFLLVVLIGVLMLCAYIYAPEIAAQVPEADPWISAYVGAVDESRMWLDVKLVELLTWLDEVTAPPAN